MAVFHFPADAVQQIPNTLSHKDSTERRSTRTFEFNQIEIQEGSQNSYHGQSVLSAEPVLWDVAINQMACNG